MNEQKQNTEEMIDELVRPERMACVIGDAPKYLRDEIAGLVEGEQIPGSFGDLIKLFRIIAGIFQNPGQKRQKQDSKIAYCIICLNER